MGGLQALWRFWLKDVSIDEMVVAWCFGCLLGPLGITCCISFAPVFSFNPPGLSPPVKYFTDRSKAVLLLWIFYVFVLSCVCYVFVRVCLYVLCSQLLGKGWPLGSRLWCLLWVCHFPIGILGQVWYLIVSIPDLCTLTYFVCGLWMWYFLIILNYFLQWEIFCDQSSNFLNVSSS